MGRRTGTRIGKGGWVLQLRVGMAAPVLKGEDDCRLEKVERVFQHFDSDGDGGLDRLEMAALVVALNPRIKFTKEQIDDIVDQVFRFYSKAARVTLDALLCIYDDIAGDVNRDLDSLGLGHLFRHTSASPEKGLQWERTSHDEEGGDVADLSFKLDRLPSMDCSVASSSFRSEVVFSEFDYSGYAPQSECEEIPSFRWLSVPSLAPQRGAGHARAETKNHEGGDYSRAGIRKLGTFYGLGYLRRRN